MKIYLWKFPLLGALVAAILSGCGTPQSDPPHTATIIIQTDPTSTTIPPTLDQFLVMLTNNALTAEAITPLPSATPGPGSCDEMDGICYELYFDGENCIYSGETSFAVQSITFIFINDSDAEAGWGIMRHLHNKTIQDMIDYIGEEPSPVHHPAWSEVVTPWQPINPGDSFAWRGVLDIGIHSIFCARWSPHGVWFGAGLMVEE